MSERDEARAEAERRMREQREQVGLMVVEQTRFIEGFEQGASWQEEQHAERIRGVTLTCDGCGEIFDYGLQFSVRECRASAARMGWRYVHRRDLCLRCAPCA